MEIQPEAFAEVEIGSYEEAACSPARPKGAWSGVIIAAPESVSAGISEPQVIPVCGFYMLPVLTLMDGAKMRVVARRFDPEEDTVPIEGIVDDEVEHDDPEPEPEPKQPVDRKVLENMKSGSYFNIDAQKYLPIRLTPGEWDLGIAFGEARSEIVRVRIGGG